MFATIIMAVYPHRNIPALLYSSKTPEEIMKQRLHFINRPKRTLYQPTLSDMYGGLDINQLAWNPKWISASASNSVYRYKINKKTDYSLKIFIIKFINFQEAKIEQQLRRGKLASFWDFSKMFQYFEILLRQDHTENNSCIQKNNKKACLPIYIYE